MSYTNILNSITVGNHTRTNANLTKEQAAELLEAAIVKFNLVKVNDSAEGSKYYAYVGEFPEYHLALDNKSGTTRLHTITSLDQLNKIK